MTGTAKTEAAEFAQIYELGVVPIPTNRRWSASTSPTSIYKHRGGEVRRGRRRHRRAAREGPAGAGRHHLGREVRATSPQLLRKRGIPHEVLNAKQHERRRRSSPRPAARARSRSPPTWPAAASTSCSAATPSSSPRRSCAQRGPRPGRDAEEYEAAWPDALEQVKAQVEAEHDEVVELGGLYVLGTERHESRRIDNQLRGRSGRQGDPGESPLLPVARGRPDAAVHGRLRRARCMATAQRARRRADRDEDGHARDRVARRPRSRQQNFEIRKNVLKYDEVMNEQRKVIYDERRRGPRGRRPARAGAAR